MAKLSRDVIKSIVKECLVEILQEGISSSEASLMSEGNRTKSPPKKVSSSATRRMGLDKIGWSPGSKDENRDKSNNNFEKNIQEATKSMTSDPVLSSILADTAMTTLQEQIGAESSTPSIPVSSATGGDRAALEVARSSPEDLFGESSSKWAQLAFANPINK